MKLSFLLTQVPTEVVVRKKRQITLPAEAGDFHEGDRFSLFHDAEGNVVLRPLRDSYAGAVPDLYPDDYVERERNSW